MSLNQKALERAARTFEAISSHIDEHSFSLAKGLCSQGAHQARLAADEKLGADEPEMTVADRISEYLKSGGLFNPELMDHRAVRALLIDARDALTAKDAEKETKT